MTVSELINALSHYDPNMPMRMSMNMEYESAINSDSLEIFNGVLYLTDCTLNGDYNDGD
jgi:hypothetical protein